MNSIGSGVGEGDADVSVAYFPFVGGWLGGHVAGNGTATALAPGMSQSENIQRTTTGRYLVSIPGVQNAATDGILFVIGGSNEDNVGSSRPVAGRTLWEVTLYNDTGSSRAGRTTTGASSSSPWPRRLWSRRGRSGSTALSRPTSAWAPFRSRGRRPASTRSRSGPQLPHGRASADHDGRQPGSPGQLPDLRPRRKRPVHRALSRLAQRGAPEQRLPLRLHPLRSPAGSRHPGSLLTVAPRSSWNLGTSSRRMSP